MNKIERIYNTLLKDSTASSKAYEYIIKDTQSQKLIGYDKIKNLDMCDQETLLNFYYKGQPVIGNIYTFIHNSKVPVLINNQEIIDIFPVFLCLNVGKDFMQGINFNSIDYKFRWPFIQSILNTNSILYDKMDDYIEKNKIIFNDKLFKYIKMNGVSGLLRNIGNLYKYEYSYAYRMYYFKDIFNLRLIELPIWPYIPFLDSVNFIKKVKATLEIK